ncbi:glycine cleavage system T protein, aminomethyltransferase [Parvularcula bermudensis HTCC2503]|uniref:Glycine cleavage system T protein, aminomethyltransferase n=1 Tax=Parvularcula bermudensis (strain ATCC BAA-594 / HTCC2503 / KCTC 12087) TaxID=314260 RepID=E0TCJ2_PARBH|nr:folate-binding protein YgfZ [Parvularcula bermudensis]ADM08581.1 glycine cleavage system T protein, aminomethyltransferase [Parvularcula bermudensis HTCC2503]
MMTLTGSLTRDLVSVAGDDRFTFLGNVLTIRCDADGPPLRYGALLTPQGKILDTYFMWARGDHYLFDLPKGRGEAFAGRLKRYALRAAVTIAPVDDINVGIRPDHPTDQGPNGRDDAALTLLPDPRLPTLGARGLWAGSAAAGAPVEAEYRDHLIRLGIPDLGTGFDEADAFPLDVNLDRLGGIDHKKGCFVGQEVASRMFRKGEIRKRTYCLSGAQIPALGQSVMVGEIKLGTVTARSGDGRAALALVRLDRLGGREDSAVTTADGADLQLTAPFWLS